MPAWYLCLIAPFFSKPLAHVVNLSKAAGYVPTQLKITLINSIPKILHPTSPADYRLLSMVPILSSLVERAIVRKYLYPEFTRQPLSDSLKEEYVF